MALNTKGTDFLQTQSQDPQGGCEQGSSMMGFAIWEALPHSRLEGDWRGESAHRALDGASVTDGDSLDSGAVVGIMPRERGETLPGRPLPDLVTG